MRPTEVWKLDCLNPLQSEVVAFTDDLLRDYNKQLPDLVKRFQGKTGTKTIYDLVWGNISFNAAEAFLLDSPILQRLRYIKQLGLTSLIYPGATHTRYAHTTGTMEVAERIARRILALSPSDAGTINGQPPYENAPTLDIVQVIRLGAMFHDTGHIICSHAGERFFCSESYARYGYYKKSLDRLGLQLGIDGATINIDFGELLSALILTSPATVDMLASVRPLLSTGNCPSPKDDAANTAALAACFILGLPVCPEYALFSTILTGSVDADKCDYLLRDSKHTGIPVALDAVRIINKMVSVQSPITPKTKVWYAASSPCDGPRQVKQLALDYSGVRNIDDVANSRSVMFEKVYTHQKVLAAEALFFRALIYLDQACPDLFQSFQNVLELVDSELICADPDCRLESLFRKKDFEIKSSEDLDRCCNILRAIYYRQLPYRCCVFSQDDLTSLSLVEEGAKDSLLREVFDNLGGRPSWEFCERVKKVAKELKALLELESDEGYDFEVLVAGHPSAAYKTVDFPVKIGEEMKLYADMFPYSYWQSSRASVLRHYYVFCSCGWETLAYIACQKVLAENYGLALTDQARQKSKIDINAYKARLDDLVKVGRAGESDSIFKTSPSLYNLSFHAGDHIHDQIYNLVEKWRGSADEGLNIANKNQIFHFLEQFIPIIDSDKWEDFWTVMLSMLAEVTIVKRSEIAGLMLQAFKGIKDQLNVTDFRTMDFFSIGSGYDSSAHISYYLNDVFSEKSRLREQKPPLNALDSLGPVLKKSSTAAPLVFFDDAFYSGRQVVAIFQELMGYAEDQRVIKESHLSGPLSEEERGLLKEKWIALAYCYGNDDKINFIEDEFVKLGLKKPTIGRGQCFPAPYFDGKTSDDKMRLVHDSLKEIGLSLLKDKKEGKPDWPTKTIEDYSLGYNNAQQLIVFPWNTPSYTMTPLWCKGTFQERAWAPLFLRRAK